MSVWCSWRTTYRSLMSQSLSSGQWSPASPTLPSTITRVCVPFTSVFIGQPFVKRFALCYRSVGPLYILSLCLFVLSVYDVGVCSQTVGRIKMKLGMQVGLGPGHIVRWGPSCPSTKGAQSPQFSDHFRNIRCGHRGIRLRSSFHYVYVTWYGARPRPKQLC